MRGTDGHFSRSLIRFCGVRVRRGYQVLGIEADCNLVSVGDCDCHFGTLGVVVGGFRGGVQ
jgi:hypothetical protein